MIHPRDHHPPIATPLPEICSLPQSENPASGRVRQRLGMRLEREFTIPANEVRGELRAQFFNMTRDEWRAAGHD